LICSSRSFINYLPVPGFAAHWNKRDANADDADWADFLKVSAIQMRMTRLGRFFENERDSNADDADWADFLKVSAIQAQMTRIRRIFCRKIGLQQF
jgi:hypothetical protein